MANLAIKNIIPIKEADNSDDYDYYNNDSGDSDNILNCYFDRKSDKRRKEQNEEKDDGIEIDLDIGLSVNSVTSTSKNHSHGDNSGFFDDIGEG